MGALIAVRSRAGAAALAATAMFASAPGQSFVLAVFLDHLLAATHLSRTAFSGLFSVATVLSAAAMVWLGRTTDRRGLRSVWVATSLVLAAACLVAGAAGGLLTAFAAILLLRLAGQAAFPLLATILVASSFRRARARAMAVASTGLNAAWVALPPVLVVVIGAVGWRRAYDLLALSVVACILPLAALLGRGPELRAAPADRVEARSGASADEAFPPALVPGRRLAGFGVPSRSAVRLLFVLSAPPLVVTAIVFHAVSMLGERGLTDTAAALAVSLLGGANAIGTIALGVVADLLSTRALLTTMTACLTCGAALLVPASTASALAGFVLLGIGMACSGIAIGVVWARTYGLDQIGRLQGMSFGVQVLAAAAGPLPLGISVAVTGSYAPALAGLAAYSALAFSAALAWRERPTRPGAAPA